MAYELFVAPIPAEMDVLHSCDVRNCVNPAHLRLGTQSENNRDRQERNPWSKNPKRFNLPKGDSHYNRKLTAENVRTIKQLIVAGLGNSKIAPLFNVSSGAVREIRVGRNWKHVMLEGVLS